MKKIGFRSNLLEDSPKDRSRVIRVLVIEARHHKHANVNKEK